MLKGKGGELVARVLTQQGPQIQCSCVTQAFSTTHLLEAILCELPGRDVLVCQGVNKMCRDTIAHSRKLQRGLFFLPATDIQNGHEPICNTLLVDTIFMIGKGQFYIPPRSVDLRNGDEVGNPTLIRSVEGTAKRVAVEVRGIIAEDILENFFTTGTWKKLYLSQPAYPVVLRHPSSRARWLRAVTFGEVLEFVVKEYYS